MQLFKIGKIHITSLIKIVTILLHIPAIMVLVSLIICPFFQENNLIFPLFIFSIITLIFAQALFRLVRKEPIHNLWEAMIGAALGWFFCSIVGAFPYYLVALKLQAIGTINDSSYIFLNFLNCTFESFSGFTSTGLTMTPAPSKLPHILQWHRSFQSWIGGMGLIILVVSLLHPKKEEYRLYLSEAKSDQVGSNIKETTRKIWFIYLFYTLVSAGLFYLAKMDLWAAINHALTALSTGGFSIADKNLAAYSTSAQFVALFSMTFGAISFSLHYKVFQDKKITHFIQNLQNRFFLSFLIIGALITFLINHFIDGYTSLQSIFTWFSALSTCGLNNANISALPNATLLWIIIAMFIGGCAGSTAGGIKINRLMHLFTGVILRFKRITKEQEKNIIETLEDDKKSENDELTEISLPKSEKSSRLYSAIILTLLWIIFLILAWFFIMLLHPKTSALNVLFDVASAISNVGLTTGVVTAASSSIVKTIFIGLMWLGRLEIIPLIVLFSYALTFIKKPKLRK